MSLLLQLEGVSFSAERTRILEEVSLSVRPGEYLALIGQNGAGKSTLIKCVAGILEGWTGSIRVEDQEIRAMAPRERARRISYVPQGGVEANPFTVDEFMRLSRYPYYQHRTLSEEDRRAVREALDEVDMGAFAGRRMNTLSGGERQMVGIAAALAQQSSVILLDEPVTFLDYRHAVRVHRIMAEARKRRSLAVIAVLHNVIDAGEYADRFLALKAGRMLCEGGARQLLEDTALLREIFEVPFTRLMDQERNRYFPVAEMTS